MTQVIMTNVASLNSQRQLNKSQSMLNTSLERLSSGLRINTAKDDAAGLAISQRMTSQINGMNQAVRNANDGVSMSQTAEASLATAGDLLTRIRELAVQSSNASNSSSDRQAIQAEVGQLTSELDRIATSTQFNGQNLLDGTAGSLNYQVGANANQTISTSGANFRTANYGDNRLAVDASNATVSGTSGVTGGATAISGYLGSATYTSAAGETAKKIADGINGKTSATGVTATAVTNANVTLVANGAYSFSITSDNTSAITVSFSVGAATSDGYAAAVTAINAASSKTGVTAQYDTKNGGLKLTNATGNDIKLIDAGTVNAIGVSTYQADGTTLNASQAGMTATTIISGQVTLDSQNSFSVTDASGLGLSTNNVNNVAQTSAGASLLKSVASLDVTTYDNSQLAIAIVDSALASVNNQRAQYGAMQNRFTSVVANLQSSSENLSASRSRIQDADFAAETATMSKANILQQAGTAMLAQANSAPQNVLSLLK